MAEQKVREIASEVLASLMLHRVVVGHSLGTVKVGGECLLVVVAAGHRSQAFEGCKVIVERIKNEVPIWGEELLANGTQEWKVNR